jgi:outer membrane protein
MHMNPLYISALCLSFACVSVPPTFAVDATEENVGRIVVQGSTLEDFFTAALDYSPELRISRDRWDINSARRKAANAQLMPQLSANGSISDNNQLDNVVDVRTKYRGERYSLQLTQVLFNWQVFSARSAAYLSEDQAEAEYFAQLSYVLTDVAEKYFAVLEADDAVTSITTEVEAVTNQLNQIESLYNLQSVQITDLYEAQARLASAQAERLSLESEQALAREKLRAISGVTVGELYRLDADIEIPSVEGTVTSWLDRARDGNQQIIAREYALRAANKRIDESQGAYMPRVSIVAQQQRSDLGFDNRPTNRTDSSYIGLDVSIPLFAGGRNRAVVSEARSLHSIAENELRQIQLEIVERTRLAYLQAKSSELRIAAAQRIVESTTLSHTAMQRGFELGTVNSVDVLNALRDRYRAERDLQQARYDHIHYNLLLKREAGSLSAEDLLDVGNLLIPPQD